MSYIKFEATFLLCCDYPMIRTRVGFFSIWAYLILCEMFLAPLMLELYLYTGGVKRLML